MYSYTVPVPLKRLASSLTSRPSPRMPTVVSTMTNGPTPPARVARMAPSTAAEKIGPTASDWAMQSIVVSLPPLRPSSVRGTPGRSGAGAPVNAFPMSIPMTRHPRFVGMAGREMPQFGGRRPRMSSSASAPPVMTTRCVAFPDASSTQ